METIYVIKDGDLERAQALRVRLNGDVPEVQVGDNYFVPVANGALIAGAGLTKPTPQMIIRHPEVWLHLGINEGGREVITKREYDARINRAIDNRHAAIRAACPGIDELRAAHEDIDRYHRDFERMMEDESNDGANPPRAIKGDIDALRIQYPVAAAYLTAESWSYASHYAKSGAGERAMKRIIAGENHTVVLADMEKEWSDHCNKHIWD